MPEVRPRVSSSELIPDLTDSQWEKLVSRAEPRDVARGEYVIRSGLRDHPMVLVESGNVELVRDALAWMDEEVLATLGPRSFVGDIGLLNRQSSYLSVRATAHGRVRLLSRSGLRKVIDEDDELGDIILRALWSRRELMRRSSAAMTLKFVGSSTSSAFLDLRRFADQFDLVHTALEVDPQSADTLALHGYSGDDLPIAFIQGEPVPRATPGTIAEQLGLSYDPADDDVGTADLVVVGGGPAGLAAAIYGASEGLSTVLLEAIAPGGQAASTSRIENFLGFPFGVSGHDLIGRAVLQAVKFGVQVCAPCRATALTASSDRIDVTLSDGRIVSARSVIVTAGASYRSLSVDRWKHFQKTSIHYAATPIELKQVVDAPVVVVGGANSAGQAALYLAANGCPVHLVVRGTDLGLRMSSYLVNRIVDDPRIRLHTGSHVTGLGGGDVLETVDIDTAGPIHARGLFCFIGAEPASSWLPALDRDAAGFIRTGTDVASMTLDRWQALGREPLPFETSIPRLFAAGDVRRGSMKRVAAAVGEGSSAVASVHRALAD